MTELFLTADGKARVDVKIIPKSKESAGKAPFKFSDLYDKSKVEKDTGMGPLHIYAFRIVYTAGIALPVCQLVMTSNNREHLEQFKEGSIVEFTYTDSKGSRGDSYTCQTIGFDIKSNKANGIHILRWGGVVFGTSGIDVNFLQGNLINGKMSYQGNALDVLKEAWKDIVPGGQVITDEGFRETRPAEHIYRVWRNKTPQNYLVDVFLHVDVRPSFPMAYIDKNGNLIVKDFQSVKSKGPSHILVPSGVKYAIAGAKKKSGNIIEYLGDPQPSSHRTYVNRHFGYSEVSAKDVKNGSYEKFSSDVLDDTEDAQKEKKTLKAKAGDFLKNIPGWVNPKSWRTRNKKNTAATSQNKGAQIPTISATTEVKTINDKTPRAFHEACRYNIKNLVNMSAVQMNVRIPRQVLTQVKVLDFVEVHTGNSKDNYNGYWVVEAVEHGFVNGETANVLYLCRDYLNDQENSSVSPYADALWEQLSLPANVKENLAKMTQDCRGALTICRGLLDRRYLNEFQAFLISLKASALGNFNLFGNSINLNGAHSAVYGLRNAAESLLTKLIRAFIKDPFAMFIIGLLSGGGSILSFILLLLSSILGGALYGALAMLIADLKIFSLFLRNYHNTLNSSMQEIQPNYTPAVIAGTIAFKETPEGDLIVTTDTDTTTPERLDMIKQTPDEILDEVKHDIVDDIIDRIPNDIDIPIPDIPLGEEDIYKDRDEVEDKIIDAIVDDLIDRGYVYEDTVDPETEMPTIIINGEVIPPYNVKVGNGMITLGDTSKVTSSRMKEMLAGDTQFAAPIAKVLKATIGNELKIRHWGTFISYNDLSTFNINDSYIDKYKTVNAVKALTCQGQRVFVALPASEEGVKFYINSKRNLDLEEHTMDVADLGYMDANGNPIPYVIYYTTEYFDTINLMLEMRKN